MVPPFNSEIRFPFLDYWVLYGVVVSLLHLVSTILLECRESLCNYVYDVDESM